MDNDKLTRELLQALAQPFEPHHVEWKPGATSRDKTKALALAYAEARIYFDRLDEVVGPGWSDDYEVTPDGQRVLCRLTIFGVTRCDVGECDEGDQNTTTTAAAQAFKRACAKFGTGRYLYYLPRTWVEYDGDKKRFTDRALAELRRVAGQYVAAVLPDLTPEPAGDGKTATAPVAHPGEHSRDQAGGKAKLERPLPPDKLQEAIRIKAKALSTRRGDKEAQATKPQQGKVVGTINEVFADQPNPDLARHELLEFLTGSQSSKDLTFGMASALLNWMLDDDTISDYAVQEAYGALRARAIASGQLDMLSEEQQQQAEFEIMTGK